MLESDLSHTRSTAPVAVTGRSGHSFDEVRAEAAARGDLAYPDQIFPLARLHATSEGRLDVPGLGELALTDWSRGQLSRMLGIRWDRWFDETLVSPEERADELNRRLQRHRGDWKLRARRRAPGEDIAGDGVLRAFVSPTYAPIDDGRVFDRLAAALGQRVLDFRFIRTALTAATSQYVAVTGAEVNLGLRTFDPHLNGILIANSEVGARALVVVVYLVRLVCTNGMVAHDCDRLHRVHRATKDDALDTALSTFFGKLPGNWTTAAQTLRSARALALPAPERTIEEALAQAKDLRRHSDAVLAAYRTEPEPNLFGVLQAITRAAQSLPPEGRLELERFAGRLLAERGVRA
jgi:hypothetical protein